MLIKTLKWPVVSLLITGVVHFVEEMIFPDLKDFFTAPVLAVVLLPFGVWVGYKAIHFGGGFVNAIIAGAILGVLPLMLDTLGFGLVLGRGLSWGLLAGLFGFSIILWGSLIGSGFALSKSESRM